MPRLRFDLGQPLEEQADLFQIQMLCITQHPGVELTTKTGIDLQAIFEDPIVLDHAGADLWQVMLGQQRAPDLDPGVFELGMEIRPGQVSDRVVAGNDFQQMRSPQVVMVLSPRLRLIAAMSFAIRAFCARLLMRLFHSLACSVIACS